MSMSDVKRHRNALQSIVELAWGCSPMSTRMSHSQVLSQLYSSSLLSELDTGSREPPGTKPRNVTYPPPPTCYPLNGKVNL
jgi:hypothetical protein